MRFSFSLLLLCAVRFEKNGKEQITKNLTKRKKTLKKTNEKKLLLSLSTLACVYS